MVSRCMQTILFVVLSTTLTTSQHVAQGYLNFNAGGAVNTEEGNYKSYGKTVSVEGNGKLGASAEAAIEAVAPVPHSGLHSSLYIEKNIQPVQQVVEKEIEYKPVTTVVKEVPQEVVYVRKIRPARRKYAYLQASSEVLPPRTGFLTKLLTVGAAPAPAPVPVPVPVPSSQETIVYAEKEAPPPSATATYVATAQVNKNGQLFNDIFNIPISTLRAVNTLVNNIASGASVAVTKNVRTEVVKPVKPVTIEANVEASAYSH